MNKHGKPILTEKSKLGIVETAERASKDWTVALIVASFVAAVNFVTMPSMFYPGDNYAPRMEIADWLMTGSLGIDYSHRKELGGFIENRGQYLYENDARQKFFSKYGFACTLMYAPPYLWHKFSGSQNLNIQSPELLFRINVWQVVLSFAFSVYLYKLARLFVKNSLLAAVFVPVLIYSTYVWHYLRSPTLEIFQMVPFLGFVYHLIRFAEIRNSDIGDQKTAWRHLLYSAVHAGLLANLKLFFVIQFVPLWIVALLAGNRNSKLIQRIFENIRVNFWRYCLFLLLPSVLFASAVLFMNWYRFGSPFDTGYYQWRNPDGSSPNSFIISGIPAALKGLFIEINEYNAFVVFPIFGFALLGLPVFFKRFKTEAIIVFSVFLLNLMSAIGYGCWTGAWCYGPRYQIHILTVGSLPFLLIAERILENLKKLSNLVLLFFICFVLGVSVWLQFEVNSVHYFTVEYIHGLFGQFKNESVQSAIREINKPPHRAVHYIDVKAYLKGRRSYLPVERLKKLVPPEHWPNLKMQIDANLRALLKPNFFFFD